MTERVKVKLTGGQRSLLRDLAVNGPRNPATLHSLRVQSLLDKGFITFDGDDVDLLPKGWGAIRRN